MNTDIIYTIAKYLETSRNARIKFCLESKENRIRKFKNISQKLGSWLLMRPTPDILWKSNIFRKPRVNILGLHMKIAKKKQIYSFVNVEVSSKLLKTARRIDFGLRQSILKRKLRILDMKDRI